MRISKLLLIVSAGASLYALTVLFSSSNEPRIVEETVREPVVEAIQEAVQEPIQPPPAREVVPQEVETTQKGTIARKEEDPEDRADPVAKAQRDYEERTVRELRNPGILPE